MFVCQAIGIQKAKEEKEILNLQRGLQKARKGKCKALEYLKMHIYHKSIPILFHQRELLVHNPYNILIFKKFELAHCLVDIHLIGCIICYLRQHLNMVQVIILVNFLLICFIMGIPICQRDLLTARRGYLISTEIIFYLRF